MKKLFKCYNDLLLAVLMTGVGAFLLFSKQTVTGRSIGLGGYWAQASTYINMLAALLLALGVIQLIAAIDFKGRDECSPLRIPVNREIVITAATLVLYALLLPKLTFFPCTLALCAILCGIFQMKENSGGRFITTVSGLMKVSLFSRPCRNSRMYFCSIRKFSIT